MLNSLPVRTHSCASLKRHNFFFRSPSAPQCRSQCPPWQWCLQHFEMQRLWKTLQMHNGIWFLLFALYFHTPSILMPWSTVTKLSDCGKCIDIPQSSVIISFGILLSWFYQQVYWFHCCWNSVDILLVMWASLFFSFRELDIVKTEWHLKLFHFHVYFCVTILCNYIAIVYMWLK